MREIKFRIKYNGKWDYWTLQELSLEGPGDLNGCNVCEFAGIVDKNGKEIYEGDRLQMETLCVTVKFEHASFHFIDDDGRDIDFYTGDFVAQNWEVIGNIYEH